MILNRELHLAEGEMILVCKPAGWTSFDVVNKIRTTFHVQRVGHAGTLDPMATGLLIVCTGKKTKELESFIGLEKEYKATVILGGRTPSFDAETPVIESHSTDDISEKDVRSTLQSFVGYQTQVPPMWSAVKVQGKPLYKYARKGQEIERRPREVFIASIEPTAIRIPEISFTVVCSKGTYVRTLVDSVGKRLGCGAYLKTLERTRIGQFLLSDAVSIEDLIHYRLTHQYHSS
jgi:tRNA pseudouridine55 synthase